MKQKHFTKFYKFHLREILYSLSIIFSLLILHYVRLKAPAFGFSLGYIHLLVIMLGSLGFGFWGGIGVAAIILTYEVYIYQDHYLRQLVREGMYWRFLSYFTLGSVLGYYVNLERKRKLVLQDLANTDTVTGLYNYRYFHTRLAQAIPYYERYGGTFSLVIIDLDHFKSINDTHGHLIGDEVLKKFADVLKNNLRQTDTIARYGGDEFMLLLPHQTRKATHKLMNKILAKIKVIEIETPDKTLILLPLTFSAGVASFPHTAANPINLITVTDDALYWAKQCGRNQIFEAWGRVEEKKLNYQGAERRQTTRFILINGKAKQFTIETDRSISSQPIIVRNISLHGALIEGGHILTSGEKIDIIFHATPGSGQNQIRIKAIIIEGRPKQGSIYEAHVVFRNISSDSPIVK